MTHSRHRFSIGVYLSVVLGMLISACSDAQKTPPQVPPPVVTVDARITFLAVGDIMISRGVARAIDRAGDPLAPFKRMESIFLSTDFNFGNLESPISGNDNKVGKGLMFNMRRRDAAGLKKYNFKVLNLANNHAMDQGLKGLQYTRRALAEDGFTYLGVGDNLAEAWRPKTIEVKGVKIGFVGASYASYNDNGAARNEYVARIEDEKLLESSINELKKSGTDFIIATMHAGVEYERRPGPAAIAFARKAIDSGADMVIGGHPHWVQIMEEYKGKYIFYSLGNFIFDQEWSRDTKEGLALKITLACKKTTESATRAVEQIELIPVIIENYSTPRPATEPEAQAILNKIGVASRIIQPKG